MNDERTAITTDRIRRRFEQLNVDGDVNGLESGERNSATQKARAGQASEFMPARKQSGGKRVHEQHAERNRRGVYPAFADLQLPFLGAQECFEDPATQSDYWELWNLLSAECRLGI